MGPYSEFRGAGYARCFPQSVYSRVVWARDIGSIISIERGQKKRKSCFFFPLQDLIRLFCRRGK